MLIVSAVLLTFETKIRQLFTTSEFIRRYRMNQSQEAFCYRRPDPRIRVPYTLAKKSIFVGCLKWLRHEI